MGPHCRVMLGADEFKQPAPCLRTAELPKQAHDRYHGRALLFLIELCRKCFHIVIERVLLFGIHLAHRGGHQIADDPVRIVRAVSEQLQQSFHRRFAAHRREDARGIELPRTRRFRDSLN